MRRAGRRPCRHRRREPTTGPRPRRRHRRRGRPAPGPSAWEGRWPGRARRVSGETRAATTAAPGRFAGPADRPPPRPTARRRIDRSRDPGGRPAGRRPNPRTRSPAIAWTPLSLPLRRSIHRARPRPGVDPMAVRRPPDAVPRLGHGLAAGEWSPGRSRWIGGRSGPIRLPRASPFDLNRSGIQNVTARVLDARLRHTLHWCSAKPDKLGRARGAGARGGQGVLGTQRAGSRPSARRRRHNCRGRDRDRQHRGRSLIAR